MRKFILVFALMLGVISGSAQTAIQTSKAFDNVSLGVTAGEMTNLDFNSVFPLNTTLGLKLQKDFTPVVGLQLEGLAILGANNGTFVLPYKTTVKGTNVGLNGAFNVSNAFGDYLGTPRSFEVSAIAGLGWLHEWNGDGNYLTSKTGLDFAFNLGKKKAHSIVISPAVYWNLQNGHRFAFNKNTAQLAIAASYVYHFKTSNDTHSFKSYDVGAMTAEINRLMAENAELKNQPVPTATATVVEKVIEQVPVKTQYVVEFAYDSAELTQDAKEVLDAISNDNTVSVVAFASPEGAEKYNKQLSEKRAAAVADYLSQKNVKVVANEGKGIQFGEYTNRIAVVTIK